MGAAVGNSLTYPIVGFAACVVFVYLSFGNFRSDDYTEEVEFSFVKSNGTQFVVDDKAFYVNGWNSYWFMDQAVDLNSRWRVASMLQSGAKMGLTVCRTWAFNDGEYNSLQIAPGRFDERVFQSLDYVIAEARRNGIRLLLSLVNNLQAFGGKTQYVKWATESGIGLSSSNDSFFFDPSIRNYFKIYLKAVLTRRNTLTGIEYRDDPTIFGWELMNEPRCMSDASGDTLQDWIEEMSTYVKSIDRKHLLTIGHEGFYGPDSPKRSDVNPGPWAAGLGTDFIRNNKIPTIDFASVHIYPDHWFHDQLLEDKLKYISKWTKSHIEDGDNELQKPIAITEFGLSNLNADFEQVQRDEFNKVILDLVHKSAKKGGAGAGTFIWQLLVEGMEEYNDDFGMIPRERSSIYNLLKDQSCRLAALGGGQAQRTRILNRICSSS